MTVIRLLAPSIFPLFVVPTASKKKGFKIEFGRPYCRLESDRSAARAP
jgi:hypothetical protein